MSDVLSICGPISPLAGVVLFTTALPGSTSVTIAGKTSGTLAISAAGAMTFSPAANWNGQFSFTAQVCDNGGTANGGVNKSAPFTIQITVIPGVR
jgi:hypothetical protein